MYFGVSRSLRSRSVIKAREVVCPTWSSGRICFSILPGEGPLPHPQFTLSPWFSRLLSTSVVLEHLRRRFFKREDKIAIRFVQNYHSYGTILLSSFSIALYVLRVGLNEPIKNRIFRKSISKLGRDERGFLPFRLQIIIFLSFCIFLFLSARQEKISK